MILSDIAKLRKMPDLAKRIEMYQPQPDPYMEQRKQLELKLLEAQAMNEWAKGQENQVDVQLKQAKTQNELAKAKSTSSDADLKDLKFIQEDRGVSHQRELEKEDMKRKTQLDLKAADAMLAPKKEVNT